MENVYERMTLVECVVALFHVRFISRFREKDVSFCGEMRTHTTRSVLAFVFVVTAGDDLASDSKTSELKLKLNAKIRECRSFICNNNNFVRMKFHLRFSCVVRFLLIKQIITIFIAQIKCSIIFRFYKWSIGRIRAEAQK